MPGCKHCGKEIGTETVCPFCGAAQSEKPQGVATMPAQPPVYSPPPRTAPADVQYTPDQGGFVAKGLGFVIMGLLIVLMLGIGAAGRMFFSPINARNIAMQLFSMLPFAAGFILTCRAAGPDFSLAGLASLGGCVFAVTHSIVLAIIACIVAGAFSGLLIAVLRAPAVITSLMLIPLYVGICLLVTQGMPEPLESSVPPWVLLLVVGLVVFGLGVLYNALTPIGLPAAQRKWTKSLAAFLAYPVAGAMAGVSSILIMYRIQAFAPSFGGWSLVPTLVFIWAVVYSSRALDNRIAPVLYGALGLWLWTALGNALSILSFSPYAQYIVQTIITLPMVIVAVLANPKALREL